jgi:hypothetical protein
MFNYLFHPYLRWLRDRSESDRPDFNIDRDGSPPQNLVQPPVNFSVPESNTVLQSAPPTGLVNFVGEQPNEIPGFRVGLRNEEGPGFNLNEDYLPHPETTWPDWVETPPPESSGSAQPFPVPPGVEEPDPPPPQPPEWLRNVLAMPVPQLSTAFDPQTGRRIVPYEPLINWTRSYPSVDQNVRGPDAAGAYGPEIGAMPGPSSLQVPAIKPSAHAARQERRANIYVRPDPAHQTTDETSSWSQPVNDQVDTHASDANVERPRRDVVLPRQQQTPIPQEAQTRPRNVPETTFSKDPVGFQPTPPLDSGSPIEFSVYNSDVDPGLDELFDLVQGIQENKAQGDVAEDAELKRLKKENRLAGFAPKTRIYAAGTSDYMVSDIMFRLNGTSLIVITEVKSGDGKLTPNQAASVGEMLRTGNIYITSPEAAKELGIKTHKTFAAQHIIPQVYITGGNQKEIARQLRNQGLEVIAEKVRPGQPPRLRVVRPI